MIRLYLDWNVLNQIKNGAHSELKTILETDSRFIKYYSTAHIGDIYSSYSEDEKQQNIIDEDLQFISRVTENNCLYNGNDEQIILDKISPNELLKDRIENEKLIKSFGIHSLNQIFNQLGLDEASLEYINQLSRLPISLDFTNESEETKNQMRSIFPELKENSNFGDFFQSFLMMVDNLNNDTGYKDLRKIFQNGLTINRDKIYDSKEPVEDIDKKLKTVYNRGLAELVEKMNENRSKTNPLWFDTIINTFLALDIAGFQEDKIQVNQHKKQTFKNTTEDTFHTAFASVCDIYITNDNRGYKKTNEVYRHLNINTANSDQSVHPY